MTDRTKAMDNLIAQDADLIDKLRDEDSYYRLQEKHWCIDAEELERQRLAAAALIETQTAELAKFKALAETLAGALEAGTRFMPPSATVWHREAAKALREYKEARDER